MQKKVRLRYIKHPPTLRTFQPNKMAVELSTLISLFLDSKAESRRLFFLDCVNSKQQFYKEVLKALEFTMQ